MNASFREGCRPGKRHIFDYYSGWCARNCGVRDDGRVVTRHGVVIDPGPDYEQEALDVFRSRLAGHP